MSSLKQLAQALRVITADTRAVSGQLVGRARAIGSIAGSVQHLGSQASYDPAFRAVLVTLDAASKSVQQAAHDLARAAEAGERYAASLVSSSSGSSGLEEVQSSGPGSLVGAIFGRSPSKRSLRQESCHERWPGAFREATAAERESLVYVTSPFESTDTWVGGVNDGGPVSTERQYNCLDCAFATESTWRGQSRCAGGRINLEDKLPGWRDAIEDQMGAPLRSGTVESIGALLAEWGPGSSALVFCTWRGGNAHIFNAINDGGQVRWIDAQWQVNEEWPPRMLTDSPWGFSGYSEEHMASVEFSAKSAKGQAR